VLWQRFVPSAALASVSAYERLLRAALSGAAATYADDERPETLYPKFDGIYRGGLLADLQVPRWHPVS
jgi:hypothetical protein